MIPFQSQTGVRSDQQTQGELISRIGIFTDSEVIAPLVLGVLCSFAHVTLRWCVRCPKTRWEKRNKTRCWTDQHCFALLAVQYNNSNSLRSKARPTTWSQGLWKCDVTEDTLETPPGPICASNFLTSTAIAGPTSTSTHERFMRETSASHPSGLDQKYNCCEQIFVDVCMNVIENGPALHGDFWMNC